jgi:molecular chaperone GrpE
LSHRKKSSHAPHEPEEQVAPEARQEQQAEPAEDPTAPLREKIEALEQSLADAEADKLRALADFQNLRRRSQEEKEILRRFATENLVTALLPVLDNFERTVSHLQAGADPEKMLEGIRIVEKQLKQVLEGQQLRRIDAVGQPFDPDLHDAIAMETSDEHPNDTIIAEIEPGYRMGDKVIRPARVKVAKNA